MANQVFANNREIACKAASGKAICAFPDVCFTPPQTPATPPGVPIPYPNTGLARDTSNGSRTVKISGQEVMLKNRSYFKQSLGDEAGCAPKKGVVTSKNRGKVYFNAWSMDVKFEGENVVRHLDLTTHNHASPLGNTAPWTYADRMALGMRTEKCEKEADQAQKACGDLDQKATCPPAAQALADLRAQRHAARQAGANTSRPRAMGKEIKKMEKQLAGAIQRDPCQRAMRCFLTPYDSGQCCPGQTPDHLIEAKAFVLPGENRETGTKRPGWENYQASKAPCLCAEGGAASVSTHGVLSARRKVAIKQHGPAPMDLDTAATIGAKSAAKTFRGCSEDCIKAQLMQYHESARTDPNAPVQPPAYGMGEGSAAKKGILIRADKVMNG